MHRNEIYHFFAKYIESELGIIYSDNNYFQLELRLEQICKLVDCPSIEDLYQRAQSGITGAFKQLLLDTATNNETSFFRDTKVFNAIEKVVLDLLRSKKSKIQIWSAASSTGQESLSVSMLINELSLKIKEKISFSILATDISERVLGKAKTGIYTQLEVQRGLPITYLTKYFTKTENDQWKVSQKISENIEFKRQNLKEPFLMSDKFDLVLCRNVLIYQNVEGKEKILSKILDVLSPGGFLVLGAGESLIGISTEFEQVNRDGVIFYRKKMETSKVA